MCPPLLFKDLNDRNWTSERYNKTQDAVSDYKDELTAALDSSAPLEDKIKSLQIPDVSGGSSVVLGNLLKYHSFPSFNTAYCHAMSRTQVEDPDSLASKAYFLIVVVSAEEGDAAESINKVKMSNLEKLEEWFGVSRGREMEVNIAQINLVLFDRRQLSSETQADADLLDGGFSVPSFQGLSTPKPQIDDDVKRYIYA